MDSEKTSYRSGEQPNFPKPSSMGERPWGEETLLCHVEEKFIMKKLFVKKGNKGGLQYHRFKEEAGYLITGQMIIRYDDKNGGLCEKIINAGETFHFPPGVVHQEEALEDCIILEASNPVFNDRVRMEKHYGLGDPIGLPSTTAAQVSFG